MSKNVEDYLKILYSITLDGKAAGTNEISRELHVAPSSVTVMLKKLDDKGYLEYSPYQGAVLTKTGYRFGEKIAGTASSSVFCTLFCTWTKRSCTIRLVKWNIPFTMIPSGLYVWLSNTLRYAPMIKR